MLALEERLSQICIALREEALLPHWEREGQHKLSLMPEPLGLVQRSRSERRSDLVTSMGCAALVVLATVVILIVFIAIPPWVPGI